MVGLIAGMVNLDSACRRADTWIPGKETDIDRYKIMFSEIETHPAKECVPEMRPWSAFEQRVMSSFMGGREF